MWRNSGLTEFMSTNKEICQNYVKRNSVNVIPQKKSSGIRSSAGFLPKYRRILVEFHDFTSMEFNKNPIHKITPEYYCTKFRMAP